MKKKRGFFMMKGTDVWDEMMNEESIPSYKKHIREVTGKKRIHHRFRLIDEDD